MFIFINWIFKKARFRLTLFNKPDLWKKKSSLGLEVVNARKHFSFESVHLAHQSTPIVLVKGIFDLNIIWYFDHKTRRLNNSTSTCKHNMTTLFTYLRLRPLLSNTFQYCSRGLGYNLFPQTLRVLEFPLKRTKLYLPLIAYGLVFWAPSFILYLHWLLYSVPTHKQRTETAAVSLSRPYSQIFFST